MIDIIDILNKKNSMLKDLLNNKNIIDKNNSQLFIETSRINSAIINELTSLKDEINNIDNN